MAGKYRYALSNETNPTGKTMKAAVARKPIIRIAVVESDPLRFVGFRALFDTEPEFELISAGLPEITTLQALISSCWATAPGKTCLM